MESVAGLDWATWETAAKNLEALAYRETANSVAPACVTTCMGRGVIGTCKNSANFDCLCDSVAYQTSVLTCWNLRCTLDEYRQGIAFVTSSCASFGVFVDPAARVQNTTGISSTDITTHPVLFSKAAFNIQAVMSSLCSLVLAIAIILGFISCRNHARREAQQSRNTQYTNDKGGRSRSYFGAAPSRPTISTVDMEGSVDFESMFPPQNRRSVPRFTNRLPKTDEESAEKWEMTAASGSGSDNGKEDGAKFVSLRRGSVSSGPMTPSTAYTGVQYEDFDSTAHLSPAPNPEASPTANPTPLTPPPNYPPPGAPPASHPYNRA